ncbi:rod-determining factor RdfA [Haloplanus halobius]|uniref:rod-determining factor RdfA n=1 Tax=Haloplanus halobius TaxID=2934938 RepID=UPI00200CAAA1|nr:rod-determining factor RdfA [Haloplanus sp. XH21]
MSPDARDYKVGRVLDRYSLDVAPEDLVERWTGAGRERTSLRELADEMNKRVLRSALLEADLTTHDQEIEDTYRILTDDDVSNGIRLQERRKLERNGVDIDQVETDLITYQAIYNFLTECYGATYEGPSDEERISSDIERIERLMSRLQAVTESDLDRLETTDRITVGEYRVFVDVQVYCRDCDSQHSINELLTSGGCQCS